MEEVKSIIETTIQEELSQLWLYVAISTIVAIITAFLVSYLKKRGENYATKSDIGDITKAIEEVKNEHAKQMEVFKGGQAIKNERLKFLYNAAVELNGIFFSSMLNPKQKGEFIEKSKNLMIQIQKELLFSDYLSTEYRILENEYNNWVYIIQTAKKAGKSKYQVDLTKAKNAISDIQKKILNYQC